VKQPTGRPSGNAKQRRTARRKDKQAAYKAKLTEEKSRGQE